MFYIYFQKPTNYESSSHASVDTQTWSFFPFNCQYPNWSFYFFNILLDLRLGPFDSSESSSHGLIFTALVTLKNDDCVS